MKLKYKNTTLKISDKDGQAITQKALEILTNIHEACQKGNKMGLYVIFLIVLRDMCERTLEKIGPVGVVAAFARSKNYNVREEEAERETDGDGDDE